MKKLIVNCEINFREIDNGFILKIKRRVPRNIESPWEREVYIDSISKAGGIFNVYLYDKAAPDTGGD